MERGSAEIVVIGGGIIGCAIAYYLAKAGAEVLVLERERVGSGSSTGCGGAVSLQTKGGGDKLRIAVDSTEIYQSLDEELGEDLEYEHQGCMIVAETPAELEYIRELSVKMCQAGVDVRVLNGDEARRLQPGLSGSIVGSTFCALDGSVNPMKVTFAFAAAARRVRAQISTRTRVENIRVVNGAVDAVVTDRGVINTKTVINAAGVWAPEIGKMVGVEVPILPRRGMLLVTEIVPQMIRGTITSAKYLLAKYGGRDGDAGHADTEIPGGLVIRPTKSGNLVFGSSREFVGYDRSTTWKGIAQLVGEAIRIVPALRGVNVIRTFAGLRPYTADGVPILGTVPDVRGFIVAAGHEGDGIALAPITGRMIADLVRDGEAPPVLERLNIVRFGK